MKKFFVFIFRIIVTVIVAGLLFYAATLFNDTSLSPLLVLLGIAAVIGGLIWSFKL
jgi:hypothetical protein